MISQHNRIVMERAIARGRQSLRHLKKAVDATQRLLDNNKADIKEIKETADQLSEISTAINRDIGIPNSCAPEKVSNPQKG